MGRKKGAGVADLLACLQASHKCWLRRVFVVLRKRGEGMRCVLKPRATSQSNVKLTTRVVVHHFRRQ
jgi:hypothetical protein